MHFCVKSITSFNVYCIVCVYCVCLLLSGLCRAKTVFVYQKALIQKLHTSFLTIQIQRVILHSKPVLNFRFKDFWYTKINLTQIWLDQFTQLYKNRFCGLVVIPEVSNDIRSKRGTFDWPMAKCWVGCLQEAFNAYNTFVIPKTLFSIQFWLFRHIKMYHG